MSAVTPTIPRETRQTVCDMHGEYKSNRYYGFAWSRCPSCAEEARAQEQARAEAEKRAEEARAWRRKLDNACIPIRFRDRDLDNFVADTEAKRRALAFAKGYADGFDDVVTTGRSAMFLGKLGTGKTHLAAGICLRIMRRDNRTTLFTTVKRAISRVKETWNRGSEETESEAIEALVSPDLLVLDEVGVQFGSEAEQVILFEVINQRYEKRLPTLLLSNLDKNGVKSFLGVRIFDRLREDAGEVVVFDWDSYRGRCTASDATSPAMTGKPPCSGN